MKFSSLAVFALATAASAFAPAAFRPSSAAFGVAQSKGPLASRRSADALFMSSTEAASKESFEFTSDVGRVMDLIINSLYSDKDIFLRELISNAADACDKKRFLSITEAGEDVSVKPEIKIKPNFDENTITIEDSGVGMTKDELINNLGRIAQSGTRNFLQALGDGSADVTLIGQFGVGFYSAYLVANKVEVVTKSLQDGSSQYRWSSDAGSSYTIENDTSDPIDGSGTRIVLHLKDEASEYLESSKMQELLQRYSEFIEFPISIWKETTEYKKVPDEEANKDLPEGEEPKMKTVPETKEGYERVNNQKPIWLRPPREVEEDEYTDFYKSAFRASYDDPMKWTHFVLEGQVECKALLYIPGMLPFELSKDMFDENARNIRLYVKRVFINDKFEDLMPRWLKFVRGVVDSNDLPLNVSREILQKSKVLSIINKRLVRKSLDMIRDIEQDEDEGQYVMFWNNFGKYLKVGVIEDDANRKEIAPLLRFFSSQSGEEYTSLEKYVEAMPEGQKSIYYVTGDGRENASMSPVIEKLASRGYEVLFATEPLDEIMMESLRNYKDKDVVDAAKENLNLDDSQDEESKKKKEQLREEYKQVAEYLETLLKGKVQKVVISDQLTDSPAALVQGAYGMSPTMQRYMRAQSVASGGNGDLPGMNQAVMEVNPNHPIVRGLDRMIKVDKESTELQDRALLMYDVAAMTSGYEVGDMKSFAARVMGLMDTGVGGISDAEIISESPTPTETEEPKMEAKMEDKKEDTKEEKTTADSTSAEAVTAEVMSDDEKKAS
ncbi:heat shock protein Hsp90 [Phaeodactylum tricornutum CCAP 1055/1]|jgi:heat shock protein beta|uniref:Heat shock protein Hsp90 n=2 Tax=Phaeodactylum tricornutum TaxID=2850 RepID=B7GEF7_PHATC|nr:heat shock protein Hsp90 [Phaeodactylum tricornutum CCAP 1055/1]EEC43000.1 heat shock protein Hsp90 [Phaeodactylum tricornutum CCAP 1055/1]|eukprot:XP_002185513.1 heat shock protein Hsp90 [Phaeodactylum tricornutum CCAP 1055/1]